MRCQKNHFSSCKGACTSQLLQNLMMHKVLAAVGSAHPKNRRACLTHIKPKIPPSLRAQGCSRGLGMCPAMSSAFQISQPVIESQNHNLGWKRPSQSSSPTIYASYQVPTIKYVP